MEFKKKTVIWEDNNEPPKNYIWIKSDQNAYEYNHITRAWEQIQLTGDCESAAQSTTEFEGIAKNGKIVQEEDLQEGDVIQPLYGADYAGPNKGDLLRAKMVNGRLEQTFVEDPDDYVVSTYDVCGETYTMLEEKCIPLNEIWYTTITGNAIDTSASTLTITSNVYENGKGVITFAANLPATFEETFFKQNNDLLSVEFPDSITAIGQRVFDKCRYMEKVRFPKGLQSIGNKAFNECNALAEINLPDSLLTISPGAFRRCYALTEVKIPNNVVELNAGGAEYSGEFQDCTGLKKVTLPSQLTLLGNDTFDNCTSLESIYIPKDVNEIYDWASGNLRPTFNACSSLKEIVVDPRNTYYFSKENCEEHNGIFYNNKLVRGCATTTIPDSTTVIGFGAFSGCGDFKHIELSDNIVTLQSWCFTMSGLESIVIPENVQTLDAWCFANCPKLESIVVDPNNTHFSSRDANNNECNCITEVDAYDPTRKTLVVGCKNTIIPPDVTAIGPGAFNNQSEMVSLSIPHSVIVIDGDQVFNGCAALRHIYYDGTMEEFGQIRVGYGENVATYDIWSEFMISELLVIHCTDGNINDETPTINRGL